MKWSELPHEARAYIIYHALVAPVLFSWYIIPYSLLESGYSVLQVGVIYTAVSLLSLPLTFIVGRVYTYRNLKAGLMIIDVLGSVSIFLFAAAIWMNSPLLVAASLLIDKLSGPLYPLYPAYERAVYPEDRMKEALIWHMIVPEASLAVVLPVMGYLFGVTFVSLECVMWGLAGLGIYELVLVAYLWLALKPVTLSEESEEKEDGGFIEDVKSVALALKGKLKLYFLSSMLYLLAWSFLPSFVTVNFIVEEYGGTLFHVSLFESAISLASIASMKLCEHIPESRAFQALMGSALSVTATTLLISLRPSFPILVLLAFAVRMGDATWFLFNRNWFFKLISKEEAALVSSAVSTLRSGFSLLLPALTGLLANFDPKLPYMVGFILFLSTIPFYLAAWREQKEKALKS